LVSAELVVQLLGLSVVEVRRMVRAHPPTGERQ